MKDTYWKSGRVEQKKATRVQILEAANRLMENGSEFSLEDVAKEANVSRATIYRYFSNIEVLIADAGLHWNFKSSEEILKNLEHTATLGEKLHEIQKYYNEKTLGNETAFRQYLSKVITAPKASELRGARRVETLKLLLQDYGLSQEQESKFITLATLLMGIEPMIVAKDVCRLDNDETLNYLQWGLEMILKGMGIGDNE